MATQKRKVVKKGKVSAPKTLKKSLKIDKMKLNTKGFLKGLGVVVLAILAFALVDLFVQYLNNDYSMAVVNGSRIPKKNFYNRLEVAYGSQASNSLIEEELIKQNASKEGHSASENEVNERVDDIKEQIGGEEALDSALKANNITMDDLKRQITLDILTSKIIEPTLEYTDKDIEEFFNSYKSALYPNEEVTFEEKKDDIKKVFISQKVEEKKVSWIAEVKEEARIQNNIVEKPSYGFLKVSSNIVQNLLNSSKEK